MTHLMHSPILRAALYTTLPPTALTLLYALGKIAVASTPYAGPSLFILDYITYIPAPLLFAPHALSLLVFLILIRPPETSLLRQVFFSAFTLIAGISTSFALSSFTSHPMQTSAAVLGFFCASTLSFVALSTPSSSSSRPFQGLQYKTYAHALQTHRALLDSIRSLRPHDAHVLRALSRTQLQTLHKDLVSTARIDALRFPARSVARQDLQTLRATRERLQARALHSATLLEHLHTALLVREATAASLDALSAFTWEE